MSIIYSYVYEISISYKLGPSDNSIDNIINIDLELIHLSCRPSQISIQEDRNIANFLLLQSLSIEGL